ncbi:MAG: zinc-ribbon domain-containing protein [Thermoplasmatales archaeon]|nr:MAG: zinc-ribbon domain-containing protein [Thermoplasmatales archaeon]
MVYCSKCGKKNDDDAEFCNKCGSILDNEKIEKSFEKNMKSTAKKIEKKAEEFGRSMERAGQRFEKKIEFTFKEFQNWYDSKFNIIGPLIWGFLCLIIFRFVIWIFDISRDNFTILGDLSDFFISYILIIFGLFLLNVYHSYFNRKYKTLYKSISPGVSTISFTISIWLFSKILFIIDDNLNIPVLTTIGNFIDSNIIFIFVGVLIISYSIAMVLIPFAKDINQK